MRVTSTLIHDSQLQAVQSKASRLQEMQDKLATGKKFDKPSDDPEAMRKSRAVEISIAEESRYLVANEDARNSLESMQTALTRLSSLLGDAREAAAAGANGTMLPADRKTLATTVDHVLESMAEIGNSRHAGHSLFAGTATTKPAFVFLRDADNRITAASYQGNSETRKIAIGKSLQMDATIPGEQPFADAFTAVIKLRDLLLNKDNLPETQQLADISAMIGEIDNANENSLSTLAKVGSNLQQTEIENCGHEDAKIARTQELSTHQDLDITTAVTELNSRDNAYRAALYAVSQGTKNSLLDFMT